MKIILVISLMLNFWFAKSVIDLEQFRYATQLQLAGVGDTCQIYEERNKIKVYLCLEDKKSRTSPIWDLAYGIGFF